jgi:DNA-binding CsgD family transcriptional regulator
VTCHSSWDSMTTAVVRCRNAAGSGKISTTSARRLISLFSRSMGLLDQVFCQCAFGNAVNARTAVLASPNEAIYREAVARVRDGLGADNFANAWSEGAALSIHEAIAYTQRGRGERKRPTIGRESLTPTEHDVAQLASEGLTNKDIAARLFVSPRTVQAHLGNVYNKLGLHSRVQLAQEANRRTSGVVPIQDPPIGGRSDDLV